MNKREHTLPDGTPETHDEPHGSARGGTPVQTSHGQSGTSATHGDEAGGHDVEQLGPIDWTAWGLGALGVVVGLAIALCFVLATGRLGV